MLLKPKNILYASLIVMAIAFYFLAFHIQRNNFIEMMGLMGLLFIIYLNLIKQSWTTKQLNLLLLGSILLRFIFLIHIPALSNDFYRFVWDGQMQLYGINPYQFKPSEILLSNDFEAEMLSLMNSKNYYSIYPPVLQSVFSFSVQCGGGNLVLTVMTMRLFILLSEVGSVFLIVKLLRHFSLPDKNVLWYALNPLIILELSGNLHFEALMIFFLLLSVYLLLNQWIVSSAVFFAVAFAIKLWPLLFLPLLWKRLGLKNSLVYVPVFSLSVLVIFYPVYTSYFLDHYLESFRLYFQHFEFNGGIHYLVRAIAFQFTGFNVLSYSGPVFGLLVFLLVFYLALIKKEHVHFFKYWYFAFLLYLTTSSTIHPWNISLLIAFAVFISEKLPILWSFLILWTYQFYQLHGKGEYYIIVMAEFMLLILFFIHELKQHQSSNKIIN